MIPFLDIRSINARDRSDFHEALERVLSSGWFVLGDELLAFEQEFAAFCGARHCIGVGNGLDALHLILRALGIGAGDEVIVPSNTFIATWLAVTFAGATPVPVEPCPDTHNVDPERIAAAVSPRTRAVIAVHLYGLPADVDRIRAVTDPRGIHVIEDAAQAHGARLRGRRAGNLALAAAFSFYPGKNLGALGDGGAVTTDDDDLAASLRSLRSYGQSAKYVHDRKGFNSRLDELQAAFLRVKLRSLDEDNAHRDRLAQRYRDGLRGCPLEIPTVPDGHAHAWHLFVVRAASRDRLQQALGERGVQTLIHYPLAPHLQEAYAELRLPEGRYPVAERLQREVLSLPIGPTMTEAQVDEVVAAVRGALGTPS